MGYKSRHRYTDAELTRAYLRDLAVDIRCAHRDGQPEYAEECKVAFRKLWVKRQEARIGRYGMPYVEGR